MTEDAVKSAHIERFQSDPSALDMPWCDSPFMEAQLAGMNVSPERAEQARAFARDGYLVIEDAVDPQLIDRIVADYPRLFDPKTDFKVDAELDALLKRDPRRRQDAWAVNDDVRKLAGDTDLLDLLKFLYQRDPVPFQTLNFLPGTEQPNHSDAIHFSSSPRGFMCGIWVPFEDVTEENGPLCYFPGSHRLPEVSLDLLRLNPTSHSNELGENYEIYEDYVRAVVEVSGIEPQRLTVKKGTALVWAYNLLHGGSAIVDPNATRMSQVTHYYFEDCVYYGPIHSSVALGELRLRPVCDVRTALPVKHSLNGQEVDSLKMPNGNHRLGTPGYSLANVDSLANDRKRLVARQTLDLMRGQIEAVLQGSRLPPLEKAKVLAQLAETAMRAAELGE